MAGSRVSTPAMKMLAATAKSAHWKGTRAGTKSRIDRGFESRLSNQRQSVLRQPGRRFDRLAVVEQQVDRPPEPLDSVSNVRLGLDGVLDLLDDQYRPTGPARNRSTGRRSWRHSFPSRSADRAISWSLESAACNRDFTVPTGIFRISAISRYFKSW